MSQRPDFSRSNSAPHIRRNDGRKLPPVWYQVDFTSSASGKHVGPTKRHIKFHFGAANIQALEAGRRSVECRGKEHVVELIWSLTSGKRVVLLDDHVIHSSMVKPTTHSSLLDSKFEHFFPLDGAIPQTNKVAYGSAVRQQRQRGLGAVSNVVGQSQGHLLKLVAHPFPPLGRDGITTKQYDLSVDGQSYFDFYKLYQLDISLVNPSTNQNDYENGNGNSNGGSYWEYDSPRDLPRNLSGRHLMPLREEPTSTAVTASTARPTSGTYHSNAPSAPPRQAPSQPPKPESARPGNFGSSIVGKIDEIDLMSFADPPQVQPSSSLDDDDSSVWGSTYMPQMPPGSAPPAPPMIQLDDGMSTIGGGMSVAGNTAYPAPPTWDDYRQAYYGQATQAGFGSSRTLGGNVPTQIHANPPQQQQQFQSPYQMNFNATHQAFNPNLQPQPSPQQQQQQQPYQQYQQQPPQQQYQQQQHQNNFRR